MRAYLNPLGAAHVVLGLATSTLGALPTALGVLLAGYALYECVYEILFLITGGPQYWHYAFESLMAGWTVAAVLAAPGLVVLALGLVELFAGVAILSRWRSARPAAMVSVLPNLLLGVPGLALGVGTLVVLADPEVRREFGA